MKKLLFLLVFLPLCLQGQYYLDKGDWYFGRNRFPEAIKYYIKETQNSDPAIKDAAITRLVDCYSFSGRIKEACIWYKKIYYYNRNDPNVILRYANLQLADKKYNNAKSLFEKYKRAVVNDSLSIGDRNIAFCDTMIRWETLSLETADVRNLRQINSKARDFSPTPYKNSFVFCSSKYVGERPKEEFYDLYKFTLDAKSVRNSSLTVQNVEALNTAFHEGPATFSADGLKVWFTRPVKGSVINEKQINPLNIFYSEYKNGVWTEQTNKFGFDYNTDFYSSCHPTLTNDGSKLYFASNMPGGFGGMDIYYVTYSDSLGWSDAINLGKDVNTFADELFPTIGTKNELYFSSKGHPGFGEMDIFKCVFNPKDSTYGKVENLMRPINSSYDDFSLVPIGNGDIGLFSSDRQKGKGEDDIYTYSNIKGQDVFIEKLAINFPNRLFFDGIAYRNRAKENDEYLKTPVVGQNYSVNFEDYIPIQFMADKDSLYYNESELIVSRKEIGEIFFANVFSKSKKVNLHGLICSKAAEKVYSNHHVFVLENELPIDTLTTNELGWFEYEVPVQKRLDFVAFDLEEEKRFLGRKYIKQLFQIQDAVGTKLPNAQITLFKNKNKTGLLTTDSTGKCHKVLKIGSELGLLVSKEGFFDKDTTILVNGIQDSDSSIIVITMRSKEKETVQGQIVFNEKPVEDVEIVVSKGNEIIEKVKTDNQGKYELHLHKNEEYDVSVSKKGFFNMDTTLTTVAKVAKDSSVAPKIAVDIKMNEIKLNKAVKLGNIYFQYNSFEITDKTRKTLTNLAEFLRINPKLIVEISSHTDNRGSTGFNLILSQKRAEAAVQFLKLANIDPSRLTPIGYGESQPINKNATTEDEHSQNRRSEFKVVRTIDSSKVGDYFRILAYKSRNALAPSVPILVKYKNIVMEKDKNDIYRYYISPIRTYDETKGIIKELNSMGYRDTKIEAFDEGEQVPIEELLY